EETGPERDVALLSREHDAGDGAGGVGDPRLGDAGVGLAYPQLERPDTRVLLLGHQLGHPLLGPVARHGAVEAAADASETTEEADRRARAERLTERHLDHLLQVRLVDPERLAVTDDGLRIRRVVLPAHPVRLLEGDLPLRLERAGERLGLDDLAEIGL